MPKETSDAINVHANENNETLATIVETDDSDVIEDSIPDNSDDDYSNDKGLDDIKILGINIGVLDLVIKIVLFIS